MGSTRATRSVRAERVMTGALRMAGERARGLCKERTIVGKIVTLNMKSIGRSL